MTPMKGKKLLAGVLSVSVLSIYPLLGAFAKPIQNPALPADEVLPISAPVDQASYLSFSGTVKEIEARQVADMEVLRYVFVENEEGQEAYLVISPDTYILNEVELEVGAKIIGFYDASKPIIMIYPPQYPAEIVAVNQKVIVLKENSDDGPKTEHLGLIVNGKKIQAPPVYLNGKGTVMVPLRPVAESLNLEVTWDKDSEQVTVDNKIKLTIGQDAYISSDLKITTLGTSPELKNGRTFVPLSFFSEVLKEAAVFIEK